MSEFLGPHGKATVVLMNAHFETELPKLKDLKKILHISSVRLKSEQIQLVSAG